MYEFPKEALYAIEKLNESSHKAYLVGGCVRDFLMGKPAKDIDITTDALPEQTKAVFRECRIIETGIKHGTVTVIVENAPIEITTFRTESAYSDSRHPDSVNFTKNVKDDLSRRDFTMNAIAYCPKEGFIDPFGGAADIENRIIRCVGDAGERFNEDALRIMRAVRFSATLGFTVESGTKKAVFANRELLKRISKERIASELTLTVCGANIKEIILEYADVLDVFIEGFALMKSFPQHNPHHKYDLLTHVANVTSEIEPTPRLRLAGLLHDIGKPACFTLDENGVGHFYGHEKTGAEAANKILKELKFDNSTREKAVLLIRYHMYPLTNDEKCIKKLLSKIGEEVFFDLIKLKKADVASHSDMHMPDKAFFDKIADEAEKIIQKNECFSLKNLAVNGNDMKKLGLEGKNIGKMLNILLLNVIESKMKNDKEVLLKEAKAYLCSHTQSFFM